MVQKRYVGITDPHQAFADLTPFRDRLIAMQGELRPFHTDYLILDALKKALDTAAYHFTREPDFYANKPQQSDYRKPKE